MEWKQASQAVSEILGTVLLIDIAVALFSVIYVTVLSSPQPAAPTIVELSGKIVDGQIIISHNGGMALNLDTEIITTVGGKQQNVTTARDFLDSSYISNEKWDIGEKLMIDVEDLVDPSINITNLQIEVTVVDVESNSIVLTGILQDGEMI